MTRRFWWSLALTAPILAFMISEFLPGQPLQQLLPHGWMNWIAARARHAGRPVGWLAVLRRGWASVVNRHLNMFTLIALGVGAAYGYSVVATLAPALFPDSFRIDGEVGCLLRAGRGHRRPRAARSGAGTPRAQPNEHRDPESARACAEDGAACRAGRHGTGRAARASPRRRSSCASDPVSAFLSTAPSSTAERQSTSRW